MLLMGIWVHLSSISLDQEAPSWAGACQITCGFIKLTVQVLHFWLFFWFCTVVQIYSCKACVSKDGSLCPRSYKNGKAASWADTNGCVMWLVQHCTWANKLCNCNLWAVLSVSLTKCATKISLCSWSSDGCGVWDAVQEGSWQEYYTQSPVLCPHTEIPKHPDSWVSFPFESNQHKVFSLPPKPLAYTSLLSDEYQLGQIK